MFFMGPARTWLLAPQRQANFLLMVISCPQKDPTKGEEPQGEGDQHHLLRPPTLLWSKEGVCRPEDAAAVFSSSWWHYLLSLPPPLL